MKLARSDSIPLRQGPLHKEWLFGEQLFIHGCLAFQGHEFGMSRKTKLSSRRTTKSPSLGYLTSVQNLNPAWTTPRPTKTPTDRICWHGSAGDSLDRLSRLSIGRSVHFDWEPTASPNGDSKHTVGIWYARDEEPAYLIQTLASPTRTGHPKIWRLGLHHLPWQHGHLVASC